MSADNDTWASSPPYTGVCVEGPWAGKSLEHTSNRKELLQPVTGFTPTMNDDVPVVPVVIGEYRLNRFNQWMWWETPAGKALRTLKEDLGLE